DDPHINAMGFFQATEFPGAPKPAPIAKVPVWLSQTPGAIKCRAPTLGEHTDAIFRSLGYDEGAIAVLRPKRVIWATRSALRRPHSGWPRRAQVGPGRPRSAEGEPG